MFRWCSYCQRFIGEREPLGDFSLTHGICKSCRAQSENLEMDQAKIQPIKEFYAKLKKQIKTSEYHPRQMLLEAKQLKIRPPDFLAGILQPALYEIGKLYETKNLTVVEEHEFTAFVQNLIGLVKEEYYPNQELQKPDVIFACSDGEYHDLGVRFLEIALLDQGISCKAIYPSVPLLEILNLAKNSQTQVIGFSITNPAVHSSLKNLPEMLTNIWGGATPPLVLLGGQASKALNITSPYVIYHNGSIDEIITLVIARLAA